jgi:hypothetical protein
MKRFIKLLVSLYLVFAYVILSMIVQCSAARVLLVCSGLMLGYLAWRYIKE